MRVGQYILPPLKWLRKCMKCSSRIIIVTGISHFFWEIFITELSEDWSVLTQTMPQIANVWTMFGSFSETLSLWPTDMNMVSLFYFRAKRKEPLKQLKHAGRMLYINLLNCLHQKMGKKIWGLERKKVIFARKIHELRQEFPHLTHLSLLMWLAPLDFRESSLSSKFYLVNQDSLLNVALITGL